MGDAALCLGNTSLPKWNFIHLPDFQGVGPQQIFYGYHFPISHTMIESQ